MEKGSKTTPEMLLRQAGLAIEKSVFCVATNGTIDYGLVYGVGGGGGDGFLSYMQRRVSKPVVKAVCAGDIIVGSLDIFSTLPCALTLPCIPYQLCSERLFPYAATTLLSVNGLTIDGKVVVDFGSGSGIQALLALYKEARYAYLIEHDEDGIAFSNMAIGLNGFDQKASCIREDLREKTPSLIKPITQAQVAIANIGPHKPYGGPEGVHLNVFHLIQEYGGKIDTVVLGGYNYYGPEYSPIDILKRYGSIGFTPLSEVYCIHPQTNVKMHTAIVLTR